MKKTAITLALVAAATFAVMSTSAFAHNNGGCGGYGMMNGGHRMMNGGNYMMDGDYGMMNNYRGNVDNEAYQAFQKETATIRSSMAADEAELNAIMAGTNPDAKRARALSESISDKQNQLAEAARKHNIQSVGNGLYCGSW